ncbi:hypothetical protein, partial [Escherichia coli]|uniref:hypothetical protein n=1 Tax=Escherichia coli TaxID=562 RepID=UPI001BDCC063
MSSPPADYWKATVTPQHNCISESSHLLAANIINIISDVVVVVLPLPLVLRLTLPIGQRIMLGVIFGAGFVVIVAGCVKAYYTYEITISSDKTWFANPVWISCSVELY